MKCFRKLLLRECEVFERFFRKVLTMSSVYDISSMYDSYKQSVQSATGSKAQSALNAVNSDSTDEELMDACKGFETYFIQKIIEQARKMVKSEEDDGEYMQYFGDTLNQSYAEAITESGQVGLAKQLYDSMKRN